MTRTCDLLVRSQTLYPTELRAQSQDFYVSLSYGYRWAAFRKAAIFGARLLGLSKLKDRASPSCSRTYCSVVATAPSRSLFFAMKDSHTIDCPSGSYSQMPTSRPRSKIP